jgi:transposase
MDVRGDDQQTADIFSDVSPEGRVRGDHPLRAIRRMTDAVLKTWSPRLARMDSDIGRPSIPPEPWRRALRLQALSTIRRERLLMEAIDDRIRFRWFIGLSLDDPIGSATTFSNNRDRLWPGDIARACFEAGLDQARAADLMSDEHVTVDGTMLEAWARRKRVRRNDADPAPPPDDPSAESTIQVRSTAVIKHVGTENACTSRFRRADTAQSPKPKALLFQRPAS